MTDTTKLVQAVVKYRTKRAEIKARQRQELEQELEPWKADVGDEVSNVRRHGLSVQDVCNAIGNQNRTFVYDMIGASARRNGTAKFEEAVNPTRDAAEVERLKSLGATYEIEYGDNAVRVVFDDDVSTEYYDIQIIDGSPDLPDEWADHTKERREIYKTIIREINDHDWT
jgi:hypothetical protein